MLLAVVPAALLLAGTGPAAAHAVLLETDPADGAALDTVPAEITLQFNEPVEAVEGDVRLHDADAARVDEGVVADGAEGTVAVAVPDELPDGGYLLVYRVASADGHPVSGVVSFTVGAGMAVDPALADDLTSGGTAVTMTAAALRGVTYLGTLLAAGAVAFALLVARRDDDRRRAQRLGVPAAALALGATLLALPVEAMAVTGAGVLGALSPASVAETLGASFFGEGWIVRVAALGLLALLLARRRPTWALLGAAGAAPASFLLDGHVRSMEPGWLLVAGDVVHLAAGAVWLGGLVLLVSSVRARGIDDDPVGAARLVSRFSSLALGTVLALTVSGAAMGWALVRSPDALTATGYGRTLLVKLALVALAVAIAAYNRRRLVPAVVACSVPAGGSADVDPALDPDLAANPDVAASRNDVAPNPGQDAVSRSRAAWGALRTTLGVEAVLLVAVLLVTGFLVVQPPAVDAVSVAGPYDTRAALTDELDLEVVVDPNRAGQTNAIHLTVLDASGRPAGEVEDLGLELHYAPEDIGPFEVEPFPAGPGHFIANVDELTFPGQWRLTVTAGVDRFSEERVELIVAVR